MKKSLATAQKGLYDITAQVVQAVEASSIQEGLCVITTLDTATAVLKMIPGNATAQDIVDDFNTVFPPRIDYSWSGDPYAAAAHSKSALLGTFLNLIIHNGSPVLQEECVLFADFAGDSDRTYTITCY